MVTVSAGHGHFVERDGLFCRGSGTEDYNLLLVVTAPSVGELHSGGFVVRPVCTEIHFSQTDDGFRRSVPDAAVTYIKTRIFYQLNVGCVAFHEFDDPIVGHRLTCPQ